MILPINSKSILLQEPDLVMLGYILMVKLWQFENISFGC